MTPTGRYAARPEYRNGRQDNRNDGQDRENRDRRHYRPAYTSAFGYGVYPGLGWYDPYLFDDADDSGYDDSAPYLYDQNPVNGGYDSLPPDQGAYDRGPYQEAPIPYQAQPGTAAPSSAPAPESGEAVTLVFKDGRPREQIHNYILSRTTLSILDRHHREIPIGDLDLAATQKANRDAGVDFPLPGASH